MKDDKKYVSIIVLGDFGRSPRMQYHTVSLLKRNFTVDIVAYQGNKCINARLVPNWSNLDKINNHSVNEWLCSKDNVLSFVCKLSYQSFVVFNYDTISCIFKMTLELKAWKNPKLTFGQTASVMN